MKNLLFVSLICFLLFTTCKVYDAKPYDFPNPVDTTTRPIELQEKKIFALEAQGVYADNQFDGARLNDFKYLGVGLFQATIAPENMPINPSPYYAFKIWSESSKQIRLELNYIDSRHRYEPKISKDGENWELLNPDFWTLAKDSVNAMLTLDISSDTLWVAAQEVQNSTHIRQWCKSKAQHVDVNFSSIGKSKLGRDLYLLDIHDGAIEKKDVIVILSRQHPPEVTGWFAMRAFVNEIMADNKLANDFRKKFHILVFPLMNPDGVDLGHWRHNAGGIDLNRDWAYYHQPENKQVANYIAKTAKGNKSDVILGLDFHSTYYDVYYTNKDVPEHIPHFQDYWLMGVSATLGEETNEKPSNVGGPVSKNWFLTQFGSTGIVYEIGDSTPRDFIKEKGRVSAVEMMKLLVLKD